MERKSTEGDGGVQNDIVEDKSWSRSTDEDGQLCKLMVKYLYQWRSTQHKRVCSVQ